MYYLIFINEYYFLVLGKCFEILEKPTHDGTLRKHTNLLDDGVPCQNAYGTVGYCLMEHVQYWGMILE